MTYSGVLTNKHNDFLLKKISNEISLTRYKCHKYANLIAMFAFWLGLLLTPVSIPDTFASQNFNRFFSLAKFCPWSY